MSTRLLQVITFANVAPAATVALPHAINVNGVPQAPDFIAGDAAGFAISATAAQVSVTNNGAAPASIDVWLELKHTTPRQLGAAQTTGLVPRPFVAAAGGSGAAPWLPVQPTVTPPNFGWSATAVAGFVNVFDTQNGGGGVVFPLAASVPNGTPMYIKLVNYSGSIDLDPSGADTIDGKVSPQLNSFIDSDFGGVLTVSDGVSNWVLLLDSIAE